MDPGTQPESLISDWPNSFVDTTPIPKRIWEAADPPADTVAQSPFPIFIPVLFSSVPLSPQNKVTRDRSWTVRLWNVTTLQDFHISSVVDINGSNRTFPICRLHMWWFLLCDCGNRGIITMSFFIYLMGDQNAWRLAICSQLHAINHVIKRYVNCTFIEFFQSWPSPFWEQRLPCKAPPTHQER